VSDNPEPPEPEYDPEIDPELNRNLNPDHDDDAPMEDNDPEVIPVRLTLSEFLDELQNTDEIDPANHLEVLTIAQEALRVCKAFTVILDGPEGTQCITSTANLSLTEESEFTAMARETLEGSKSVGLLRAIKSLNRIEELYSIDLSEAKSEIVGAL
jgi:hypothetical protein